MKWPSIVHVVALLTAPAAAFAPTTLPLGNRQSRAANVAPRRKTPLHALSTNDDDHNTSTRRRWSRLFRRLDTIESSGYSPDQVRVAGIVQRIKDLHNPKTYLLLALIAGLRWDWCFRNPYYWFGVAFCVKWYRARYVFKIPVWDRQPNWNNIITSREQEKDLKAYTCKKCGSTIFIAKTREFFFEGNTGIGGLGCFSCGAKGKENFVMDRDRIVEDVADMDDYFEYERPLDFVSRAERRALLKEAKGDEEKANQLLLERTGGDSAPATEESSSKPEVIDVEPETEPEAEDEEPPAAPAAEAKEPEKPKDAKPPKKKPSDPPDDDDILDILDMD